MRGEKGVVVFVDGGLNNSICTQRGNFHLKVGGLKSSGNAGHPIAIILGAAVI